MAKRSAKCPYCKAVVTVGQDALECKHCGAYAMNKGAGIYKWYQKSGTLDQLKRTYNW